MIQYFTEFIGTFIFLSVILNAVKQNSAMKAFAPLAIGLALTTAIEFGGNISGGHFNPAVSIMFYLQKGLSSNDLLPYIGAQVLGGVAAYYFFTMTNEQK